MTTTTIPVKMASLFSSKTRVKIIQAIITAGELNITSIIKAADSNYTVAKGHIEFLKQTGIVQEVRFGRIRILKTTDTEFVKILRAFIASFPPDNEVPPSPGTHVENNGEVKAS